MARQPKPAPPCIECGGAAELVEGQALYRRRPDLIKNWYWVCGCGAHVGCHKGSKRALGSPAGPETRAARQEAHRLFDPLWKRVAKRDGIDIGKARGKAYKWLQEQTGLSAEACHISLMNRAQCETVQGLCRRFHG